MSHLINFLVALEQSSNGKTGSDVIAMTKQLISSMAKGVREHDMQGEIIDGVPTLCFTASGSLKLQLQEEGPESDALRDWLVRRVIPALWRDGRFELADGEGLPIGEGIAAMVEAEERLVGTSWGPEEFV